MNSMGLGVGFLVRNRPALKIVFRSSVRTEKSGGVRSLMRTRLRGISLIEVGLSGTMWDYVGLCGMKRLSFERRCRSYGCAIPVHPDQRPPEHQLGRLVEPAYAQHGILEKHRCMRSESD